MEHVSQYMTDGTNLDCLHPVQDALDALCGPSAQQFPIHMENWFEAYAEHRGIKDKAFAPMTSCVQGSVFGSFLRKLLIPPPIFRKSNSSESPAFNQQLNWPSKVVDPSSSGDVLKLPLTCLKPPDIIIYQRSLGHHGAS